MAKPLVFLFGDHELPLQMVKVDRSKLYGSKDVEAEDENEQICELATLADDGRTMIGKGGTGLGWIDADGNWSNKSELKPCNVDGDEITPVKSSFLAPIKLFDTATAEEYLEHNVRLVYALELKSANGDSEDSDAVSDVPGIDDLMAELKRGTILKFPYSYRGGLEADMAFLLLNDDDEMMMVVGNPTDVSLVGIQSQASVPDEQDVVGDVDELVDFGMI